MSDQVGNPRLVFSRRGSYNIPQILYIKAGYKGVFSTWTCLRDDFYGYVSEKGLSRQKTDVSEAVTDAFPDD